MNIIATAKKTTLTRSPFSPCVEMMSKLFICWCQCLMSDVCSPGTGKTNKS